MYKGKEYNIFICYRGSISGQGGAAGALLYGALNEITGFEPFYANAVLDEGADNFKNASRQVLKETKVFILLLTPGFFDECSHHDDMVKDEIQTALRDARIRFIPITLPGFDAKREFTKEVRGIFEGDFEERIEHISQIAWNNLGRFEIKDKLVRTISRILDDYGKDNAAAQAASDDRSSVKSIGAKDARLTIENGVLTECAEDAKGELIIPNGVTGIGKSAFEDCTLLTSVIIPDSVTRIGDNAFAGCDSLTSVTIPDSVTRIGESAFSCCHSLTSIAIPDSVTRIGDNAFSGCDSLASVTIPDSVTRIGEGAFEGCESLTSIIIPDSVTSIGDEAFVEACVSLEKLTVAPGNPKYHSAGNCIIETATKTLIQGCKNSVIPDGVTSIGSNAFNSCISLSSVTIPDSVTSIGGYAFYECNSLEAVHITDIGKWVAINFGDEEANPLYYAGNLYLNGELVTDLVIPDGVTSIGDYAFRGCESLTSVTIPDSVTNIGRGAFQDCYSLTYVTIPDSVTSIGDYAFSDWDSLTSVTIPNGVTSMSGAAFATCSSLERLTVAPGNPKYHSAGNCIIETETGTLIRGCNNSVIPTDGSVTRIGDHAFSGCHSLTSVTIPDGVTSIGESAFSCCSLTSIAIPDGVTSIRDYAFAYCTALKSIAIPDSVTSIGSRAFDGCTSLTSITIPDSVTSIGGYAFVCCDALTFVTFEGTVEQWNEVVKGNSWNSNCLFTEVKCSDGVVDV